jgi:hypothetical protein
VARDGAVACSVRNPFGTSNIAVRLNDESGFSEVTEGDSLDAALRWVPGKDRCLIFQSAGVGRDRNGNFAGVGPFSIQELHIVNGELTTIEEDPRFDFLTPQKDASGALYYISRPYRTGRELHPLTMLKDTVLFPFRLAHAIFHYLQVFSMMYTGKKLTSAGGARSREMDLKEMMIWGNRISAAHGQSASDEASDLVPKTWRLFRQQPGCDPELVASGVVAYDLAPDGTIVYSNGAAIFAVDASGKTERIHVERLIEQVAVLP